MGLLIGPDSQIVFLAIPAAVGIAFLRWLLHVFYARWASEPDRGRFVGPEPSDDEKLGGTLFGVFTYCLVIIIGLLAFVSALTIIRYSALLLGFPPETQGWSVPNSGLLLWALLVAFYWVQFGHLMRLRSVWSRARFTCFLISLPLLFQIAARLMLNCLEQDATPVPGFVAADRLVTLLFFGLLPYLVPTIHERLIGPALTRIRSHFGGRSDEVIGYVGNALLLFTVFALVALSGLAWQQSRFANYGAWPPKHGEPVPSGPPHLCLTNYPAESMRLGEQGTTTLSYHITTSGTIRDVTIIRSSGHPRLDLAAVVCVTHWTYSPAVKGGQRVEVPWKAQVVWRLR